ncbi:hypothetical protein PMIN05_012596, partial [Paraphaeosphaeria minitans]
NKQHAEQTTRRTNNTQNKQHAEQTTRRTNNTQNTQKKHHSRRNNKQNTQNKRHSRNTTEEESTQPPANQAFLPACLPASSVPSHSHPVPMPSMAALLLGLVLEQECSQCLA